MSILKFKNGKVEDYTIVLSTRNYHHLGQLSGLRSVNSGLNLSNANESSFTICKYDLIRYDEKSLLSYDTYLKIKQNLWEQIVDHKLIWIKELNEYYEIKVNIVDSNETIKNITATSLCEAELSQIETGAIEINTENDILRDDYEVTTFYNAENPKASYLNRLLDKAPHYTIAYVAPSLCKLQRTLTIDSNIYDHMIGECSEQFNCLFKFDTTNRSIYVYDLLTVCNDCGKRGDFYDICPECGSDNLEFFGEDTTILVDKDNLTDEIQLSTNADNSKNCFYLVAGDDLMTATIRMLNPSGSDYIISCSEDQLNDMSEELRQKLAEYDAKVSEYDEEYKSLVSEIYDLTDEIINLESGMMPDVEIGEVTAQSEANKLTQEALSSIALTDVTTATSVSTVSSAIANYAKIIIKSGYVKLEVIKIDNAEPTFDYIGIGDDGWGHGIWRGRLRITNYSDEEDVVETEYLNVSISNNYEEFIRQKLLKELSKDDDEGEVLDVLSASIENFEKELPKYCLNRLISFHDAIQGALNVLIQMDQAQDGADLYDVLYLPYYDKLQVCQKEIDKRKAEIDVVQSSLDSIDSRRIEIQKELDFESFLGEYYKEFCAYRREQKYSNENYISDGLSNAELIERAQEFIEKAKQELLKAREPQWIISSSLKNLLVLPEFKPLLKHFKLGNWIRLRVDDVIYRLRLIGYSVNFDSIQTINVVFSTVSKLRDIRKESNDIINSAKAMATNFAYVKAQATKGENAKSELADLKDNGLISGLIQISNNKNEEVTITKHGLLAREYDDISGTYSPKELKVTHNVMAFTDNSWRTCRQVIGEHQYQIYDIGSNSWIFDSGYGMTADFVNSGKVIGTDIYGGIIRSLNYSNGTNGKEPLGTIIDLNEGTFSFAGGNLSWDGHKLAISSQSIEDVLSGENGLNVTAENLSVKASNIVGDIGSSQISSINAEKISGKITSSQIQSITAEQISNKIKSDQIESISFDKITGTIIADSVNSVAASNITGTIASSQIANTLSNKTVSGSFSGSISASSITTTSGNTSYTGITISVVLENQTLHFVNGLLVNVITN